MTESRLLTGNEAVAWAVARAGAQVVAAYPITPQTTIIESPRPSSTKGVCGAEYMPVKSGTGARRVHGRRPRGRARFTATSGQGLALMHELIIPLDLRRAPAVVLET